MIKAQTIVIKEKTKLFFAGESVSKNINIHNDVRNRAKLKISWFLKQKNGKIIASGQKIADLGPAELHRMKIKIQLPEAQKKLKADFSIKLTENNKILDQESQEWEIFPKLKLNLAADIVIPVFDSAGNTIAALNRIGVKTKSLKHLSGLKGRVLIIGTDALMKVDVEKTRNLLQHFTLKGGKILIMPQQKMPEFLLPFSAVQVVGGSSSMCFVRTPDHPVMQNVTDKFLHWWGNDHIVSQNNFWKPIIGNWLPLIDSGTIEGCINTPLFEEYLGKGSYIVCQLQLLKKNNVSPAADILLKNIVNYLVSPKVFRKTGKTALFAGGNTKLIISLKKNRLSFEKLGTKFNKLDSGIFNTAILLASLKLRAKDIKHLRKFVKNGGKLMVQNVSPANRKKIEKLIGLKLILDDVSSSGSDVRNHVIRTTNHGIMSGISNHELIWASDKYLKKLKQEGCWWSYWNKMPKSEYITNYFCRPQVNDENKAKVLTEPCVLMEVPYGKGSFLINQLNYMNPIEEVKITVIRLVSLLLTNLNCTIKASGQLNRLRSMRLKNYKFNTVDLSPYANRGLKDDAKKNVVGWTNQGVNDMCNLPTGQRIFKGVPFFISKSPKAVITLYSNSGNNKKLPKSVNIKTDRNADAVFFMHSMAWGGFPQPFRYRINYSDKNKKIIYMYQGQHVADWWINAIKYANKLAINNTVVAWKGPNSVNKKGVTIYCHEWINPYPNKKIKSIDFMTTPGSNFYPVPVLVGITTALKNKEKQKFIMPRTGKVVAITKTGALKIKSKGNTFIISCIGAKDLSSTHPYYAEAVKKIKELCLNKNVAIKYGAVKKNQEGSIIAYIYFKGQDTNIGSSINSKLIGDGIFDLGSFYGNDKFQSYFSNLKFISKSNKTGRWE